LELARAKLPMIIAYKVSWLTAVIARRLLKIKFACLLNILAGKEIVPEFLQERCVPEAIALKLLGLIESQKQRDRQIKNTQESLTLLKGDNHYASERAAQEVLESALNKA
jgi:lipid-A-disaccharide synthase